MGLLELRASSSWNSFDEESFMKNLLWFMEESESEDSSSSSGYQSEIYSLDQPVTSGNNFSFSGRINEDPFYRRCNFSNLLRVSWTDMSAGLISSVQETKSGEIRITLNKGDSSCEISPENQKLEMSYLSSATVLATVKEKSAFFKKSLRNSLLKEFENHPERLRRIQYSEKVDLQEHFEFVDSHPSWTDWSTTYQPRMLRQPLSAPCEPNDNMCDPRNYCRFCFKNGEPEMVYMGHLLKATDGAVTCPILRKYRCQMCGATGANSHTRKYCPLTRQNLVKVENRKLANGVVTSMSNHK